MAILLTLLHLGIKNIRLGPTLPAFVTPAVLNVLVEKFNIMPITTPEEDLAGDPRLRGGTPLRYKCMLCKYIYDPEKGDPDAGVAPGTDFEDLPDDWVCPLCGAGKQFFKVLP